MDKQGVVRLIAAIRISCPRKSLGSSSHRAIANSRTATLMVKPRIGEKLEEFEPREVRRILVGHYEIRYEIQASTIYMLRLWHTREDR